MIDLFARIFGYEPQRGVARSTKRADRFFCCNWIGPKNNDGVKNVVGKG